MRVVNFLFIVMLYCLCFTSLAQKQCDSISVISFNIRLNTSDDGVNIWDNRKANVLNMVNVEKPDFLCIQEAYFVQLDYLDKNLPDFSYIGVGRDDGEHGGEHMAILYNKNRFKVEAHGDFWLSETPDVCSRGWDAACHRIVTWGYFVDNQTGKHIYCFNTHLDHVGEVARRESLKLISKRIKTIVKDKKAPVFLTGDFNSDINNEIFDPLKKIMKQARKDAPVTDNKGTFNGWGSAPNNIVIDHIFYNNAKPIFFKTLNQNIYGRQLISDHYPIKAVFVGK